MIWRIRCIFALQSLAFGAWLPRIPEVKDALNLSPSTLALVLLGMPLGILAMLPFAGRLVGRIGPATALLWLFPPYLVALALPAFAPTPLALFLALGIAGILMALIELAQNLLAHRIEKATSRFIMSSCHGFWSLGTMAGSVVGAGLAGLAIAPDVSGAALVALTTPLVVWLIWGLRQRLRGLDDRPAQIHTPRTRFQLPDAAVLKIGLVIFGVAMAEGAVADWAALYLRDTFALGAGVAGLGLTTYAAFMTLGRLSGDRLRLRFGAMRAAQVVGGAALVALLALVLSPVAATAYVALALLGLGTSLGFPLAVSAASDLPGRKIENSVATITFLALLGFLIGPVLIGFVAEGFGLRWGLASVGLPLALSLAMTPSLRAARAQPAVA